MILYCDFETRSRCDLRTRGVYNYAQHASTDVLCMSYAFDDEEVRTWLPGQNFPPEVENFTGQIRAHNATFERLIFWYVLGINFTLEQFYCTAAQARANCAPGSLEDVGRFAGAGMKKDHRGNQLIRALSVPQKDGSFKSDNKLLAEMIAYCEQDVRATRAFSKIMRDLTPIELAEYHVNERINDRGVLLDLPLAVAAQTYAAKELDEIQRRVIEVTEGHLVSVRSPKMRQWVWDLVGAEARKLMTTKDGKVSIDKNVRASLLMLAEENHDEVPFEVAEVIQCADDLWASSVAKFQRLAGLADEEDHRVRGAFVFAGGSATGRASSYGAQVHNFARVCAQEPEAVRAAMVAGQPIVPRFGRRVTDVLKGMLRPALLPAPGKRLVVADWSSIEARVNPWLSGLGVEKLRLFEAGADIYKANASATFSVPIEAVTKDQRQIGKVQELACLSEDTLVLTSCGEKPIQYVRPGDLVWDGKNWVKTDGAIYKGERHVIEYDGLCATPDHLVWIDGAADPVSFGWAAANRMRLVRPRAPIEITAPSHSETAISGQTTLREHEIARLQDLWWARRQIRVCNGVGGIHLGVGKHRAASDGRHGVRPDRQYKGLCAGQSAVVYQSTEPPTYVEYCQHGSISSIPFEVSRRSVRRQYAQEPAIYGSDIRSDCSAVGDPELQAKRRVWDLLNCGPLHRFTASGRLVHNCGFGGGVGAFSAMGRVYGLLMPEAESRVMVNGWRRANQWAVHFWGQLERAYMAAMRHPGREFSAGHITYLYDKEHLWYMLPSGRILCYPYARLGDDGLSYAKAAWKPAQDAKAWPRARLWSGLACENVTQATAHDILRHSLTVLDGYAHDVVLHVHDEIVIETDDPVRARADLERIMCTPPGWAKGLPLAVEVSTMERYGK